MLTNKWHSTLATPLIASAQIDELDKKKESYGNVETTEKTNSEKPRITKLQKETEKCESVFMILIPRSQTLR